KRRSLGTPVRPLVMAKTKSLTARRRSGWQSEKAEPAPVRPTLWYIIHCGIYRGSLIAWLRGLLRGRLGIGDAVEDLFRQLQVGLAAAGVGIVKQSRLAVAGGLGESDVARDRGLAHEVAEEAAQLGGHRLRQVGAL